MKNKKELLLKIKALAESGVGGEKVNAQKMLSELMNRYNLKDSDLDLNVREWKEVIIPRFRLHNKLFWHIVASTFEINVYRKTRKRDVVLIELTNSEYLELIARYEFYSTHFNNELDAYVIAFVQKNKLYPVSEKASYPKELTAKQYAAQLKAMELYNSVGKYDYDTDKSNGQLEIDFDK